jgi:hypothetical protein
VAQIWLIQNYADHWGTMTSDHSGVFIEEWPEVDSSITQLRRKHAPIVAQVLDGKKSATFFLLDRRTSMLIDLQPASQPPIVLAQE